MWPSSFPPSPCTHVLFDDEEQVSALTTKNVRMSTTSKETKLASRKEASTVASPAGVSIVVPEGPDNKPATTKTKDSREGGALTDDDDDDDDAYDYGEGQNRPTCQCATECRSKKKTAPLTKEQLDKIHAGLRFYNFRALVFGWMHGRMC